MITATTANARVVLLIVRFLRAKLSILPSILIRAHKTSALVAVVPKAKVTINGPTKSWAGKGSSGKAVHRIFCSECGSPIAHDPDAAPEIIAMKAGTLDMEIKKKLQPVSASINAPNLRRKTY